MDAKYTGDLQADAGAEFTAPEQGYRNRAKAETDRFKRATDSEYWVAVRFTTRKEKGVFLWRSGLAALGDKYLDGHYFAHLLAVELD